MMAAAKLDEYWSHLRLSQTDLPGRKFLLQAQEAYQRVSVQRQTVVEVAHEEAKLVSPRLAEALVRYVGQKGAGRVDTFRRAAERACGYLIDAAGEKPLSDYTRSDALSLRDYLVAKGLSGSSITRILGSIRAVINFNIGELALSHGNPFVSVYYDRSRGVTKRATIPEAVIGSIQDRCKTANDEKRWLIAMVSDSGARLGEVAGLLRGDIVLNAQVPHIVIRPHPWRSLKTKGSERRVPLVGAALWAAKAILAQETGSKFAFPLYNKTATTNANSASGALNKWLKVQTGEGYTIHGFRHAMRDRLRAVECPSDIADQIGGWISEGVGQGYGEGYSINVTAKWLEKIVR
jgi:integrase